MAQFPFFTPLASSLLTFPSIPFYLLGNPPLAWCNLSTLAPGCFQTDLPLPIPSPFPPHSKFLTPQVNCGLTRTTSRSRLLMVRNTPLIMSSLLVQRFQPSHSPLVRGIPCLCSPSSGLSTYQTLQILSTCPRTHSLSCRWAAPATKHLALPSPTFGSHPPSPSFWVPSFWAFSWQVALRPLGPLAILFPPLLVTPLWFGGLCCWDLLRSYFGAGAPHRHPPWPWFQVSWWGTGFPPRPPHNLALGGLEAICLLPVRLNLREFGEEKRTVEANVFRL